MLNLSWISILFTLSIYFTIYFTTKFQALEAYENCLKESIIFKKRKFPEQAIIRSLIDSKLYLKKGNMYNVQ